MNARFEDKTGAKAAPPPQGFFYVDQANYVVVNPTKEPEKSYLYSDSATSCIIVIVSGQNAAGDKLVSLCHVDSPDCISSYFTNVLDRNFTGSVSFYAQGANPPDNETAIENAAALKNNLATKRNWQADNPQLYLLQGDPREANRGDFGINLTDPLKYVVSNQTFDLELLDRDPTGGVQVMFCIMRRKMAPPVQLWDAKAPFPQDLVCTLVNMAAAYRKDPDDPKTAYTYIINLQDQEVRNTWSSTPDDEAPWFSDELKQSCCYVRSFRG